MSKNLFATYDEKRANFWACARIRRSAQVAGGERLGQLSITEPETLDVGLVPADGESRNVPTSVTLGQ
jgi:hypothetical protein